MPDPAAPAAPVPVPDPAAAAPALATPETPVAAVDIPADGGFPPEPVQEPPVADATPDATPDPKPADAAPVIKKSPYQARIDVLTAQREQEKREKEAALRQADVYKAMAEGRQPVPDPNADPNAPAPPVPQPAPGLVPGSQEFQKAVRDEAMRVAAFESAKTRMDGLLKAGNTDYKDFTERCNIVASMGAGDRADFMEIVTDPNVIPDGHKVIGLLAENPEEAARILALPTIQMTAALLKFQAEKSKAPDRPVSAAPTPIRPIDGTARADTEPKDTDDMATYAAKYKRLQEQKLKTNAPSRFARH